MKETIVGWDSEMLSSLGEMIEFLVRSPLTDFLINGRDLTKGMFGNYFFPLFSAFKNNFLFLRLKNLFSNSKWAENKNCFQISICDF